MKRKLAIGAALGLAMAFQWRFRRQRRKPNSRSIRRWKTTSSRRSSNPSKRRFRMSASYGCAIPPGVITARFLAEKDNPRADMVMGLAASSLLLFEKMNLLETYKPAGVDALKPEYRDSKEPYTWTGMDAFIGVICFNTAEAGKAKIAAPDVMEGSHQGGIQGPAGDAASGVFRHRLSHRGCLAADHGRAGRLEVHGRAA